MIACWIDGFIRVSTGTAEVPLGDSSGHGHPGAFRCADTPLVFPLGEGEGHERLRYAKGAGHPSAPAHSGLCFRRDAL